MMNRGFEPWTFRSCLGYQHFVINDNNRDQRKKDSKKTSTATVAEIKTEANVAEKASALVAATDHGVKDSNKLQQALMTDGSEGKKKKSEFGCGIDVWDMLPLTKDEVNLLFQKFHKVIETQYNAKQNGVAERKNRHLLEVVRASLIAAQTSISYWGEAITSAAYLINRVPSSSINFQTPLQALTNAVVAPTVPNLPPRVFGCVAFVHLHKYQRTKLTSHALQCVFVGYALHKKGYRCYHPPTRQMYITMDVVFHEDSMYFSSESELQGKYRKEIQTLDYDYHISEENESGQSKLVNQEVAIPNSVQEALADPKWKATMNEEMKSLQKNETWELVECPPRKKPVGCRWIYTVKYKADGSIERFKVRLVAKGYTQTYGIDYTETFAPVAKINTVRVLLSLAANLDWPLQQFDVKNVFLHGELSEEVYMDLPPGCMVPEKQCQKVCKLKKSLYGLKQSPRAWFERFTKSMRAFGYRQSNSDHTLFLKKQHGKITTLIVYVDDMVVTGNDPEERKVLQNYLSREFEMKDLDLLQETGMSGCQPVNTPIKKCLKLCVEPNQVSTDKGRYQRLVGRLMYLAHTRPDLAYAWSVVSQYMHNPGEQHMNAVMRILRYLKNAPRTGILFAKNVDHQSIEVYTDADWAGAVDDRRSTSGYFTFVGGNLMTWKSKKQNVVARSSAEAEFRGMTLGLCEALWLRLLLQDLGYLSRQPIRLFCDNKAACDIAHNLVQSMSILH
ncbi:Retrovirus-related Pol polyprotein from transposon RE1 [Vitis vinifera]|uniref:Retrovirus-related Pol polyprotein from transposon RE1 n=1 Tax=Vitis vinifera TaxID=29760 RepID=A0A438K6V3_VITVI|nr:Retrovirus-related Pol polyprotein from transposon RE1 [Vitis vinifera]